MQLSLGLSFYLRHNLWDYTVGPTNLTIESRESARSSI
jgi:hypothetical protein